MKSKTSKTLEILILANEWKIMTIEYQDPPYTITIKKTEWQKQGIQQTAFGYGHKLVTEYMLHLPDSPHAYRVYSICYANAASFYILRSKRRLFLRDGELEEARDKALGN